MLAALECGARLTPFSAWVQQSESFGASKAERLDEHLRLAYGLLRDSLALLYGREPAQNRDIAPRLARLSAATGLPWLIRATRQVDELVTMARRNIQKTAALDALIINLRNSLETGSA
jgi:hypothetical protein